MEKPGHPATPIYHWLASFEKQMNEDWQQYDADSITAQILNAIRLTASAAMIATEETMLKFPE